MDIIERVKIVAEFASKMADAEFMKQIIQLQSEAFDLKQENQRLKESKSELEDKLRLRDNLVFEKNFYWLIDGESKKGPFCPRCFTGNHKAHQMLALEKGNVNGCPICNMLLYKGGEAVPVQMIPRYVSMMTQQKYR